MIKIYSSHIITADVEVIINPVTTDFSHLGEVGRLLITTAGEKLILEQEKIGLIPVGDFAITTAGNLWAKKVFHVCVFDHEKQRPITYEEFEDSWRRVLYWCRANHFNTVAAPMIGSGLNHWDSNRIKDIMLSVAGDFDDLHLFIFKGEKHHENTSTRK
ncbi:MAG: macro domain-containing protein [Candidatus Spechtbacterales bacterium]|nr:macro domain-containing protein [Candidatus Spechtbacterales bacterium]